MDEIIDKYEYKGRIITVFKDSDQKVYFKYEEEDKEVKLYLHDMKEFLSGNFSHTTLNENNIDMIERSVKINNLLYNERDLKERISKYT